MYFQINLDEPVDSCTHKENSLSNPIQSTRTPIKELETEMLFPTPLPTDGDKLLNCHSPQPMVVIPMEQLMSPSLENKVLLEDEVLFKHSITMIDIMITSVFTYSFL